MCSYILVLEYMMKQSMTNAEYAILGLLAEGASHGYDLEQKIENRGMRDWTEIGFSSIYFVLGKLEKKGLINSKKTQSPKGRKTFNLTPEGYRLYSDRTYTALSEPHPLYPSVLLGLANWPALKHEQAIQALKIRAERLKETLTAAKSRYSQQFPLPDFVDIQFGYSISQLEAELSWAKNAITTMESQTMSKIDFKKTLKELYLPSSKAFEVVNVPKMNYIMIDGASPPHSDEYTAALSWLYPLSYGLKFMSKQTLKKDYVVPPLEGLWWAEDMTAFTEGRKEEWLWTMMIMQPDWITDEMFFDILESKGKKLGTPPSTLRFETYDEGISVQIMHIGPYSEEGPTLARLHNDYIPKNGLAMTHHHHEIYISDPRRTAPEKLKTVLRQPVKRI